MIGATMKGSRAAVVALGFTLAGAVAGVATAAPSLVTRTAVAAAPAAVAAATSVPGCPAGAPEGANCLLPATNGTPVQPAPAISYAFKTRYHQTSEVGTFTATFAPPYKECPNPGAIAYQDIPCMESRTLSVDARLYVPGAASASIQGVGAGPVVGGACDLSSCQEQLTLTDPYIGPGTVILHYAEQAVVNGGAFEDHSFDVPVGIPAVPLQGLSHVITPTAVFRGSVSGSKRLTLKVHGVPSSAAGLFAIVHTAYPAFDGSPAQGNAETQIIKGHTLVVSTDRKAVVTVTVTGWVDGSASTSGLLLHRITQERVKGSSIRVAHVPSNAKAVLMSVSTGDRGSNKIDGIVVDFDPVGLVVPLSHGKLSLQLGKGTTAYVQGYFAPVGLTDDGQQQFIQQTDEGSDFFGLPDL